MTRRFRLSTFFWIVACAAAIAWLVSPPLWPDWAPAAGNYHYHFLNDDLVGYVVRCVTLLPFRLAFLAVVYAAFMMCKKLATKNSPTAK